MPAVDSSRPGILGCHLGNVNPLIIPKHLLVAKILLRQHGRRRLCKLTVGCVTRLISSIHDISHHISQLIRVATVHIRNDLLSWEYHIALVLADHVVRQVDHFVTADASVAEARRGMAQLREVLERRPQRLNCALPLHHELSSRCLVPPEGLQGDRRSQRSQPRKATRARQDCALAHHRARPGRQQRSSPHLTEEGVGVAAPGVVGGRMARSFDVEVTAKGLLTVSVAQVGMPCAAVGIGALVRAGLLGGGNWRQLPLDLHSMCIVEVRSDSRPRHLSCHWHVDPGALAKESVAPLKLLRIDHGAEARRVHLPEHVLIQCIAGNEDISVVETALCTDSRNVEDLICRDGHLVLRQVHHGRLYLLGLLGRNLDLQPGLVMHWALWRTGKFG
mmetsp:Transcript_24273/g.54596  ORF Transcript_24273/g.54596 Transcript_24273/m.54596 type:complete len:390 (-) Transcript_24273:708-1877(-)